MSNKGSNEEKVTLYLSPVYFTRLNTATDKLPAKTGSYADDTYCLDIISNYFF